MPKFPSDLPLRRVLCALGHLGFKVVREGNHIALARGNDDGSRTTLTIPNHAIIKAPTLRTVLSRTEISRESFLAAYERC